MFISVVLQPLILPLMFVFAVSIFSAVLRSSWFKGVLGEAILRFSAYLLLDAKIYHPFHDVTLRTDDGSTQIDHVFVSRFGVFVVETKNLKGWIFGTADQPVWTQKIHRKSFRFQNPLRQNYRHTKAIEVALDLPQEQVFSVVAFVGGSSFKSLMPPNVTSGEGCTRYILSHRQLIFTDAQVSKLCAAIDARRLTPGFKTSRAHVNILKERHTARTTEPTCPGCGGAMQLRATKSGSTAGKEFWGCVAYPRCRGVRKQW